MPWTKAATGGVVLGRLGAAALAQGPRPMPGQKPVNTSDLHDVRLASDVLAMFVRDLQVDASAADPLAPDYLII